MKQPCNSAGASEFFHLHVPLLGPPLDRPDTIHIYGMMTTRVMYGGYDHRDLVLPVTSRASGMHEMRKERRRLSPPPPLQTTGL